MLSPEQFDLVNRGAAPWLTLWLIEDFPSGKAHAVGSLASGTWHSGDLRGMYETTGKGMAGRVCRDGEWREVVSVTWAEVGRWSAGLTDTTRARARELRTAGQKVQRDYPPVYPGIGRAYCWDARDERHTGDGCKQCETDRADLDRAHEKRDAETVAWQKRSNEHRAAVAAFIESLRPVHEPDLLDLMGALA